MSTNYLILVTEPETNAEGDTAEPGTVRLWVTKDLRFEGSAAIVDEQAVWFGQEHPPLKRPTKWSEGSRWIPGDAVTDMGIFAAPGSSRANHLRAISSAFKRGAQGTGKPKDKVIPASRIVKVPLRATWEVPAALPTMSPAEDIDRPTYKHPSGSTYVGRWMPHNDDVSDVQWLQQCAADQAPVFLYGEPGCGKTWLAETALSGLIRFVCNERTEVNDLVGSYVEDPTRPLGVSWQDGPLLIAMKEGRPLLLDESALADPRILSLIYPLTEGATNPELLVTTNPAIGTVVAKTGFYILFATNPNAPGAILSEALLSRAEEHLEVRTDYVMLEKVLKADPHLIAFAREMSERQVAGQVSWAPQTREITQFAKSVRRSGEQHALSNLIGKCPVPDREIASEVASKSWGRAVEGHLVLA